MLTQCMPRMQMWDLGGQASLRPSWATYYKASHAVIMVVDSTDRARIGIVKVSCQPEVKVYAGAARLCRLCLAQLYRQPSNQMVNSLCWGVQAALMPSTVRGIYMQSPAATMHNMGLMVLGVVLHLRLQTVCMPA